MNHNAHMKETMSHTYPMKTFWQLVNQLFGFWAWLCVCTSIVASLFLLLVFRWARKVIPAFRKVMAGEPRSFLRISENGLEYRNWPFGEIRCEWKDLQFIKRHRFLGDTLIVKGAEEIGFAEFSMNLSHQTIHLSSLAGWPDGGLEDDLRNFAPRLFSQ